MVTDQAMSHCTTTKQYTLDSRACFQVLCNSQMFVCPARQYLRQINYAVNVSLQTNLRMSEKGGLSLRGVAFITVLTVLESTLPSFCLSYNIQQHKEATMAGLVVSVLTATPLKLNPPLLDSAPLSLHCRPTDRGRPCNRMALTFQKPFPVYWIRHMKKCNRLWCQKTFLVLHYMFGLARHNMV